MNPFDVLKHIDNAAVDLCNAKAAMETALDTERDLYLQLVYLENDLQKIRARIEAKAKREVAK